MYLCVMIKFLLKKWCELIHGGGRIKRDPQGRINWQCDVCGRWSDYPISLEEEEETYNQAMKYYKKQTSEDV